MMAAISTFDQWQKDVFFSAAEEVQESADTMESVYRMWVRGCSDGFEQEFLDELRRDLHTAHGTAKWQLEEFERAVNLTHENCPSDDITITRHNEFIAAIRNKISHIEKAINDSLLEERKQQLRWIQLDEEERDDFENFLSMAPNLQETHESVWGFKETVSISKDSFRNQEELMVQDENLNDDWKIMINDEDDADNKLVEAKETKNRASSFFGFLRSFESTAKLKWFRNSFGKVKSEEHVQSRQEFSNYLDLKGIALLTQGINRLSERSRSCFTSNKESPKGSSTFQQIRRVGGFQRHFQVSQYHKRSLRVTILLVLTVFLIVPFVFYST